MCKYPELMCFLLVQNCFFNQSVFAYWILQVAIFPPPLPIVSYAITLRAITMTRSSFLALLFSLM
jgi:hypothetical protein